MIRLIRPILRLAGWLDFSVAAWLAGVLVLLLPRTNPEQIPLWTVIGAFFIGLGVLTFGYLVRPLQPWRRFALGLSLLVAFGLGAFGLIQQGIATFQGADSEGYIVLLALLLVGQAFFGLIDLWFARERGITTA